jgi:DNA polymerase/3'-5' exonuclease PolX
MNDVIVNNFKLLVKQIQYDIDFTTGKEQSKNMFRLKSISTALKAIENYPEKITNSNQLKNIKGIGSGTLKRVDEILETGKLDEVKISPTDEKYLEYITNLEEVFGIGRKTAYDLFKTYKVKTVEELKNKYDNKEIELSDNIVKGLKYVNKIQGNIPRSEMDEIGKFLLDILPKVNNELFGTICGSYRRLLLTSNDVDFIVVHPKNRKGILNKLVKKLIKENFIVDSFTEENVKTKYMGIFKWKSDILRRIDIRYIPYESYYTALLYFTGSKNFNKKMRLLAVNQYMTLNEYGLYKDEKIIKVNSEKEIFDLLGMEYVSPDKRN